MSLLTIVVGFAALLVVTAIGYFVVYFFVAPRSAAARGITKPEEMAAYRDALLRGPVQFGGGTIAVITLLFTIVNGIAAFRQSADQQANQQFFGAAQMAISEIPDQKAESAPSSDNLKSAAIYSFKNIVLANSNYCDMVRSILLGTIHANTKRRNRATSTFLSFRVEASVSAAILMLGTIPPCLPDRPIRVTDQYLAGADFGNTKYFAKADLRGAKLSAAYFGSANFDYARFDGAKEMGDDETFNAYAKPEYHDERKFKNAIVSSKWRYEKYNYIANF